jgi:hypothetical protein
MRTLTLSATAEVTLSGTGGGTAQAGPSHAGEVWYPATVSVSVSTNTSEAECKIYCGALAVPFSYVDGTLSGSTGDSTTNVTGQVLYPGSYVFAVWTGGDSGSVATVNVQGTRQVP